MIFLGFILGLLIGFAAWYLERVQYDKLWEDYRKLLNASVRPDGRVIYPPEKQVGTTITPIQANLPRIMTPDMAITEAEDAWEKENLPPMLTEEDMKHLMRTF